MKAMVLSEYKKPLSLKEVDLPKYRENEVLLKVKSAGVCGTDKKIQNGMVPTKKLPMIPGHEISGIIVKTGNEVQKFKKGDEVLVSFYIPCDNCRLCIQGRQTICENPRGRLGFELNGGFAEFVAVPEKCLLPKPENINFRQAAIVSDAVATCYHALIKRAKINERDTVVIVGGGGGLGQHAIQIADSVGAKIIGVDIGEEKLQLMEEQGAKIVIDAQNNFWDKKIRELTQGRGADVVVELVCSNQTIKKGINSLCKGGKVLLIAYNPAVKFNAVKTHLNEIDLINTRAATKQDIKKVLELIVQEEVRPVVDQVLNLKELNKGLSLIKEGNLRGRLVVDVKNL